MLTHLTDSAKAFLFYGMVFGLTLGVALLAPLLGGATPIVHMLTPFLAVLLMLLVVTRDGYSRTGWGSLGVQRLGLRSWPFALLTPLLVLSVAFGLVWRTGVAQMVAPPGASLTRIVVGSSVGILVSAPVTLSEELGFRGYVLPRLMHLGTTRALLLSGLLHSIWHLPLRLLTPYYHNDGNRLIVVSLFLLTLTVSGVFFGYLRLTSGSIWPSTLAHGAFNDFWSSFSQFTVASSPLALEYLAGESGVLTLVGTALVAAWLVSRLRQRRGTMALQLSSGV
jgi:membrane protease YdiL (CAAX protease family)